MSVLFFKIVAILAIFATGVMGGLMARVLSAGRNSELVFALEAPGLGLMAVVAIWT